MAVPISTRSTQEKITPANWLFEYVSRVIRLSVRKTKAFVIFNLNILFRPVQTSKEIIKDDDPAGVVRALKYYSKMFAIAFSILLIANRFKLYEGESEWRMLVTTAGQLLVALAVLYAVSLVLPDRIPFFRLVQAVLYVDGIFAVVNFAISVPVSYVASIVPSDNRELDIFSTEYERCLAHDSLLYWLLRGDIKFFLYSDVWKPQDWANWFFENYDYVLIIPFVFVFALMLRPTTKISFFVICLSTAALYGVIIEGTNFLKRELGSRVAVQNTKCTSAYLDEVTKNYASDRIARQLVYKINNDSRRSNTYFAPLKVVSTDLVVVVELKPSVEWTWQLQSSFTPAVAQSYCSNNPYWLVARRINYRLLFAVYKDQALLYQNLITPRDCPAWPRS
jgi:hypothetical protein